MFTISPLLAVTRPLNSPNRLAVDFSISHPSPVAAAGDITTDNTAISMVNIVTHPTSMSTKP
jgi:hypothetical protein